MKKHSLAQSNHQLFAMEAKDLSIWTDLMNVKPH
jgi:hypothetical protein